MPAELFDRQVGRDLYSQTNNDTFESNVKQKLFEIPLTFMEVFMKKIIFVIALAIIGSTKVPQLLAQEAVKPDGSPYHVLIADDSMFIAKQLEQILISEGYEVADIASDGEQAIEKYKALYPNIDLVTLDITMPVMDGVSVVEKILEFDKNANIIMVSSLGKEDVVIKCLLMGAKSYIVKPINLNLLRQKLAMLRYL